VKLETNLLGMLKLLPKELIDGQNPT
jgi:hypothetical protein